MIVRRCYDGGVRLSNITMLVSQIHLHHPHEQENPESQAAAAYQHKQADVPCESTSGRMVYEAHLHFRRHSCIERHDQQRITVCIRRQAADSIVQLLDGLLHNPASPHFHHPGMYQRSGASAHCAHLLRDSILSGLDTCKMQS